MDQIAGHFLEDLSLGMFETMSKTITEADIVTEGEAVVMVPSKSEPS